MKGYILKRLLSLIPVLMIVSVVVFLLIHITPGDPAAVILGPDASPAEVAELREQLGLNLPLYEQFAKWLLGIIQGDLGYSYFMDESVLQAFMLHLGPTFSLAVMAQLFAVILAIPLGVIAARKRGTIIDQTFMGFSLMGISVPSFLLGLFLILFFAVKLKILPVAGYKPVSDGLFQHVRYLLLPTIALGSMQAALIARMTRSTMLDILNANYIKTARSKGVKEIIIVYKHALKNAFIPILTVIGQTFGTLIAGAAVVETVFNIPGIGQLIVNSVERRDFAVIQGSVLLIAISYVAINLVIDLLYSVIDPRVRLAKK
ncbi:ABC transporter permease [Siminovitchia sp. FSL H7-0308]|uniref:Peptide/nickel transport system permease protein n=1 Tax=Siminovitchia thermophila TaxID=1245522 RepID=A0ABS2R340_9BACI|nr:ABC transporter permease [Siminovitchia thermophila]MBM7714063.1 peptide/nickel transport system permease protein [Siminovitchia thermophila]ONK21660.1 peptide ABC transporter [Bacillus sp. VT-16-64]